MQWHLRTIKSLLIADFVLSKLLAEACYLGNLIVQVNKKKTNQSKNRGIEQVIGKYSDETGDINLWYNRYSSIAYQYSIQPTILLAKIIFGWFQFWQSNKNRKKLLAALFSKPMYYLQVALYTVPKVLEVGCKGVQNACWEMKAGFWACGNYFFNPWVKKASEMLNTSNSFLAWQKALKPWIGNFEREF